MPSVFTMVAISFLTFQIADVVPDPAPIWSYQALGAIRNPASIGKGLALAGSEDGKVYAIRLVDGLLAYAYDAHSPVHGAPLIEPEGTAVVGSEDGFIHGFHAQNGRSLWKYATGGPIVASPTLVPGGIVVVGSTDNRIYAINITTGKLRWVFRTGGPIETAAAIGLDGTVVVGAQDGKLYGLDPENGASRWQFDLGGLVSSGPAVDGQGRIFQVAGAGRLFVLASNGSIVTRANLPASCPTGLVLDPTDRLYFGFAEDGPAVRLGGYSSPEPQGPWNPAWSIPSTEVRGAITRPMAIGLDEVIYAVSEGGDLLTVDGRSGKVLGKTDLGAGIPSGLTLDTSGLIVVSDNSGRLRGFKARAGDWPTSGQNVQRSNRADGRLLFPGEVVELSRPPGAGMLDPELSPAGFAALAGGKIYAEQGGNFVHVRWKDENGRLLPNVHRAFITPIPTQTFEMGDEIPLPVNASLDQTPTGPAVEPTESSDDARSSLAEGAIFWHVKKRRGFAARPGSWTLVWKTAAGTRIPVRIRVRWPEEPGRYQIRVAKTPPISLTSDRFRHAETWVRDPGEPIPVNDRHLPNGLLSDDGLGRTFLILGNRPEGLALADSVGFLFVKTVAWDDPLCQATPEDVAIGSEIIPPAKLHNPEAGGPFVYREQARYCSMTGYYDRMKREGPIIPVNVDRPETQDDDLLIVYYRLGSIFEASQGEKVGAFPGWPHANRFFGAGKRHKSAPMTTKIGWPMTTVLYRANWPDPKKIKPAGHRAPGDPAEIVIARNRDPETLSESAFTHPTIYYQNEPNRPGFNPNDEHAFLSGNVVWALRDDLDTPETSAPWVLVTYTDPQDKGRAKIKLFHVVARVSDEDFRYGATAGTLIQPPNALRSFLRPRGREDTLILGPGYLDRSGNIWAKSAGVDGSTEVMVVHYRYAMQEGFFFPKAFAPGGVTPQVGDLVPWLDRRARLDRQAKNPGRVAGVDHEPIDVVLDVSWPEGTPELRQGDTLLTNRAEFRQGLPDLFNMAAVRLIYQESIAKKKPASVNLIDPLRVRSVPVGPAFRPPVLPSGHLRWFDHILPRAPGASPPSVLLRRDRADPLRPGPSARRRRGNPREEAHRLHDPDLSTH